MLQEANMFPLPLPDTDHTVPLGARFDHIYLGHFRLDVDYTYEGAYWPATDVDRAEYPQPVVHRCYIVCGAVSLPCCFDALDGETQLEALRQIAWDGE
jgi:hypothetical protein